MLLSLDPHEHLINEERVTITLMLSSQSLGILLPKFIAPQSNCFVAHLDATAWHQIFDITMTEVESMAKPHCILNDFGRNRWRLYNLVESWAEYWQIEG
jgi:hypothetical protein